MGRGLQKPATGSTPAIDVPSLVGYLSIALSTHKIN